MSSSNGRGELVETDHHTYSPGPLAWRRGRYGNGASPVSTSRAQSGAELVVEGEYLRMHTDELMELLADVASQYDDMPRPEYSIEWDTDEDRLRINFADPVLAQAVAKTLYHSCDGQLNFHYQRAEDDLRAAS